MLVDRVGMIRNHLAIDQQGVPLAIGKSDLLRTEIRLCEGHLESAAKSERPTRAMRTIILVECQSSILVLVLLAC